MTSEGKFSRDDWHEVFTKPVPYPENLPDDLIRTLANLRIDVGTVVESVSTGVAHNDALVAFMGLSLTSGDVNKIAQRVNDLL